MTMTTSADERPADEPVGDDRADRVVRPIVVEPAVATAERPVDVRGEDHDEEIDGALAQVRDDEAEHGDEDESPAQQRARRVQPMPLAVGEIRDRCRARGCAHNPARRVSASATSSSRRRSASSIGQSGHGDRGRGGGGHELEICESERSRDGAARDVDELHAPVGHRDLPLEHDAPAEQQVVFTQAVLDRAHATWLEHDADDRRHGDGDRHPERPLRLPQEIDDEPRTDEDHHADERADDLDDDVLRRDPPPVGVDLMHGRVLPSRCRCRRGEACSTTRRRGRRRAAGPRRSRWRAPARSCSRVARRCG